jgi:hypothetical protein
MGAQMEPIDQYYEDGIKVKVYPEKKSKHRMWQKNDTFYAAKMRIPSNNSSFVSFTRKKGKA